MGRIRRSRLTWFMSCLIVIALAGLVSTPSKAAAPPPMQKVVTDKASFVAYTPQGWKVAERAAEGVLSVTAADPVTGCEAGMALGDNPAGDDVVTVSRRLIAAESRKYPGLQIKNARISKEKSRVVFDGQYSQPQKGAREFRSWVSAGGGRFSCARIEAPAGRLEAEKPLLLTVLSNIRVIKGTFAGEGAAPTVLPLAPYRLRDGSASFQLPQGWKCQDFGKGSFIASDPGDTSSFSVGSADESVQPPHPHLGRHAAILSHERSVDGQLHRPGGPALAPVAAANRRHRPPQRRGHPPHDAGGL